MTSTHVRVLCVWILSAAFAGCQPNGTQTPALSSSSDAPATDGGQISVGGRQILPGSATLSNSTASAAIPNAAKFNASALGETNWQQRGERAGKLRRSFFSGGKLAAEDVEFLRALQGALSSQILPEDFAKFQSSAICSAISIAKTETMHDIQRELEKTAAAMKAENVSLMETTGPESPVIRSATDAIRKMLAPEERTSFDRLFRDAVHPDLRLMASP